MSTGVLSPVAQQRFFDDNGLPLAGGKLYSYISGTATPLAIYTDPGLTVAYTNPIILDADGYTGALYLQAASYTFYLTDATGVPMGPNGGYTDGIASTSLSSTVIGSSIFSFGGDPTAPVTDTSYPSGTTYDKCHAGTTWFSVDSSALVGTYALDAMLLSVGGVTVTAALVNLSDGTPDTPMVTCASTSATGTAVRSTAITFGAGGITKTYAIKAKVSAGAGSVWGCALIRTA